MDVVVHADDPPIRQDRVAGVQVTVRIDARDRLDLLQRQPEKRRKIGE